MFFCGKFVISQYGAEKKCRFLLLFVFGCIFLPTIRNVPRQVFGNAGAVLVSVCCTSKAKTAKIKLCKLPLQSFVNNSVCTQ